MSLVLLRGTAATLSSSLAMLRSLVNACAGGVRKGAAGVQVCAMRSGKGRGWYYRALDKMEQEANTTAMPPFPDPPLHGQKRKRAFLDVEMGGEAAGRVVVELAVRMRPVCAGWCRDRLLVAAAVA